MTSSPTIVAAAAAAILSTKTMSAEDRALHGERRFVVHPHIASVGALDTALTVYIDGIYDQRSKPPTEVAVPSNSGFAALKSPAGVQGATRAIAESLCEAMESTTANAGVVFGFLLKLASGQNAWGVVKADLDDAERFFMNLQQDGAWTIDSVRDVLPPPKTDWAKYAIVPRPKASGGAGIRDTQTGDAAAGYFLTALGVVVPRNTGAKAALATAAKKANYSHDEIKEVIAGITVDRSIEEVVSESFPEISDSDRKALSGSPTRPRTTIIGEERLTTKWSTPNPKFVLIADDSVAVEIEGKKVTVTLPDDHGPINRRYEK